MATGKSENFTELRLGFSRIGVQALKGWGRALGIHAQHGCLEATLPVVVVAEGLASEDALF